MKASFGLLPQEKKDSSLFKFQNFWPGDLEGMADLEGLGLGHCDSVGCSESSDASSQISGFFQRLSRNQAHL
jgi:hypothetical protein